MRFSIFLFIFHIFASGGTVRIYRIWNPKTHSISSYCMIALFQYYFRCIETKEVPKKTRKIFPCLSKMLLFDLSALKVSMTRLFLSSQFRLKPKNKFAVPEAPHFCISHFKRNIHYTRKGFFYHGKTANLCEIQSSLETRHNRSSSKLLFSKANLDFGSVNRRQTMTHTGT